jgi:hypothetical protein
MCLLEQALIARKRIEELGEAHHDYNFYYGKLLSAQYYLRNVVPNVWSVMEIVQEADTSVLDAIPETFNMKRTLHTAGCPLFCRSRQLLWESRFIANNAGNNKSINRFSAQ